MPPELPVQQTIQAEIQVGFNPETGIINLHLWNPLDPEGIADLNRRCQEGEEPGIQINLTLSLDAAPAQLRRDLARYLILNAPTAADPDR